MKHRKLKAALVAATIAVGGLVLTACAPPVAHCATTANGGDNDTQTTTDGVGGNAPEIIVQNATTGGNHTTRTANSGAQWLAPATSTGSGIMLTGTGTQNCYIGGVYKNVEANPIGTSYTQWYGRSGYDVRQNQAVIEHAYFQHNGFGVSSQTDPTNNTVEGNNLRVAHSHFNANYAGGYRNDELVDGGVLEANLMECLNACVVTHRQTQRTNGATQTLDSNLITAGAPGGSAGTGPSRFCSDGQHHVITSGSCTGYDYEGWIDNGAAGATGVVYALVGNTFYAGQYPEFGTLAPPTLSTAGNGGSDDCRNNTIDINVYGWSSDRIAQAYTDVFSGANSWTAVCGSGLTVRFDASSTACTTAGMSCKDFVDKSNAWQSTYGI